MKFDNLSNMKSVEALMLWAAIKLCALRLRLPTDREQRERWTLFASAAQDARRRAR